MESSPVEIVRDSDPAASGYATAHKQRDGLLAQSVLYKHRTWKKTAGVYYNEAQF